MKGSFIGGMIYGIIMLLLSLFIFILGMVSGDAMRSEAEKRYERTNR